MRWNHRLYWSLVQLVFLCSPTCLLAVFFWVMFISSRLKHYIHSLRWAHHWFVIGELVLFCAFGIPSIPFPTSEMAFLRGGHVLHYYRGGCLLDSLGAFVFICFCFFLHPHGLVLKGFLETKAWQWQTWAPPLSHPSLTGDRSTERERGRSEIETDRQKEPKGRGEDGQYGTQTGSQRDKSICFCWLHRWQGQTRQVTSSQSAKLKYFIQTDLPLAHLTVGTGDTVLQEKLNPTDMRLFR